MKNGKYKRVVHWLKKNPELSNAQLKELTGAGDHTISDARAEIGINKNTLNVVYKDVDKAYKKFLAARGKEQNSRTNFNGPIAKPK